MHMEATAATMAEADTGATGAQAAPETQPPAGSAATQAEAAMVEQPKEPESISLEQARKLRSENQSLRERTKALEEAQAKADEAKLSDLEKANKRTAELEKKLTEGERATQERVLRHATEAAAVSLGMKPDLVYRLLDHSAIEFDADGEPKNLREQITALAKTYPELVGAKAGTADGGTRGQPALTREAIEKMKPEEINARWEEISKALPTLRT